MGSAAGSGQAQGRDEAKQPAARSHCLPAGAHCRREMQAAKSVPYTFRYHKAPLNSCQGGKKAHFA